MEFVPLAAALGAEVRGVDISKPLSAEQVAEIRAGWMRHLVLLFRDQQLSPEQQILFTARFGELETHENYLGELRHPDHPELLVVKSKNVRGDRIVFGQQWHSDLSYTTRPSLGSCLYSLAMPPVGGDTMFTNMYLAYETLSPGMRKMLVSLNAVHDLSNGGSYRTSSEEHRAGARKRNPPVVQPVVRKHPETRRDALFISEWTTTKFEDMTADESRGLLEYLFRHSTRPEFTFRQKWKLGDALLWDNRATLHLALADYPADSWRELNRASLKGSPLGRLESEATAS